MDSEELRKRLIPPEEMEKVINEIVEIFLIPAFNTEGYQGGTMNASGRWLEELEVVGNKIRGMSYTEQLEYGRRPGIETGSHPPPIGPLIRWVEVKLGLTGDEAKGAAYAIRMKIHTEGTTYYPEGTKLMESLEKPEVAEYVKERMGQFVKTEATLAFSQIILQELKQNK